MDTPAADAGVVIACLSRAKVLSEAGPFGAVAAATSTGDEAGSSHSQLALADSKALAAKPPAPPCTGLDWGTSAAGLRNCAAARPSEPTSCAASDFELAWSLMPRSNKRAAAERTNAAIRTNLEWESGRARSTKSNGDRPTVKRPRALKRTRAPAEGGGVGAEAGAPAANGLPRAPSAAHKQPKRRPGISKRRKKGASIGAAAAAGDPADFKHDEAVTATVAETLPPPTASGRRGSAAEGRCGDYDIPVQTVAALQKRQHQP
ncbi:hypothetical protein T492DRAFT_832923 [Pavlovales sp. CCMP2436]|nr:hypothetical protein T492DRAFT_832923 [Pavlovales sp. CCMP2436]